MIADILFRVLKKIRLIENVNIYPRVTINRTRFVIPIIGSLGRPNLYLNRHESWMYSVIEKLLDLKPGVFIDVGVNIGQTLLKVKSISPGQPYVGFEPNPYCHFYTSVLIKRNKLKNTTVIPVGLSDTDHLSVLNLGAAADAEATMIGGLRRPDREIKEMLFVAASRFDGMGRPPDTDGIGLVKIDVEGAELEVIAGMAQSIRRHRPILICEVLHAYSRQTLDVKKSRNQKLMAMLKTLNYTVHRIAKSGDGKRVDRLPAVGFFDDVIWSDHTSPNLCDYLFVPDESTAVVVDAFAKAKPKGGP